MSCLGPTLPTLADNLQTHVDNLSHIVTARGGGYMIGSLIGGFLYELDFVLVEIYYTLKTYFS